MTTTEPRFEPRPNQPYAAVRVQAPLPFGPLLGPWWGEVFGWLGSQGLKPSGPPFIRYLTTDMSTGSLDLEVGVHLEQMVAGNGRIVTGLLPAGRYQVMLYTGPYENLVEVTGRFIDWANQHNVTFASTRVGQAEWWVSRLEWYPTDPAEVKDPQNYETELAFLVAE